MRVRRASVAILVALPLLVSCFSTQVRNREARTDGEKFAKPTRIVVYDFAATSGDVPANAAIAGNHGEHAKPQTAEEIELGRKLGLQVAMQLAAEIRGMGLPAMRLPLGTPSQVGDLLIGGYFASVDEGSTGKRLLIGFGSGSAELQTFVEIHQRNEQGLRLLGSASLESGGTKSPGLLMPVVVTAVTANPIGLVVGGAVKGAMELSGANKIEATAGRTAHEIAEQLRPKFEEQGWIAAAR